MRDLHIAMVGAGIAGLTAARALQGFGFRVRVYEQAQQLGEVGAGLTISPNATHVLNAIGLQGVMERIGMQRVADGDFDHPQIADTHLHLRRFVLYRMTRDGWLERKEVAEAAP